jgi:hypothetical protein
MVNEYTLASSGHYLTFKEPANMRFQTYTALVSIFITSGCHQIESHNIPTDAVQANITIVSHETGSDHVEASLRLVNEPLAYLQLSPGELLTANSDGIAATLFPSAYGYTASLPPGPEGRLIQVGFYRARFGSAPDSFAIMPPAFSPFVTTEETADSDQILIEWDTISRDTMRIRAEGNCMHPYEFDIQPFEDDGLHVIPAEALPVYESWFGDDCRVVVNIDRVRHGDLDPALSGGQITAVQRRSTYFSIYR